MAVLVIRLPADPGAARYRWTLVEDGARAGKGEAALGDAPALPDGVSVERAVALLPSEAVFVRRLSVPGASERDARRAAPFLIEEQLAQPLEDAVIETGPKGADGRRYVLAAGRAIVESWRRCVAGLGVKPVHLAPDAMMIEGHGADLAAVLDHGRVVFQTRNGDLSNAPEGGDDRDPDVVAAEPVAGAVEADLASLVLPALADRIGPRRIIAGEGVDPDLLAPEGVPVALKRMPAPDLDLAAAAIDPAAFDAVPPLLGAGWSSGIEWAELLAPFRTAAVLALAAVFAVAALSIGQALYYEARTEAYRDAEIAAFQQVFPDTRVVDPQAQLRRSLAAIGAEEGSGAFLELAAALSAVAAEVEDVEISAIRYDAARGGLSVTARYSDFGDFEALRAAADQAGVVLEDGGARQAETGVVGDFTVRTP
ncbi:MAG: type II secretion system protein GspL [Oceanicaulis sp.]